MLWLQLRDAAAAVDEVEMTRLILQILNEAAETEEGFRPLREQIRQDEARLVAAAERMDATLMTDIIGGHCRAMFKIRHGGWPIAECDELIGAMKMAYDAIDTILMVDVFERLLRLCQSESRTSIRQARLREMDRGREQVAVAVGGGRWEEAGLAFTDMLSSLADLRPDYEELPSLIAEAKASGVLEGCADSGVALAEKVYSIVRALVDRYANKLDRSSFDAMMSALIRGRAKIPPGDLLLFLSDTVGRAVTFREGSQRLPLPAHRPQFRSN